MAVANGLANAKKLVKMVEAGEAPYAFVECMACPGGEPCGGGGVVRARAVGWVEVQRPNSPSCCCGATAGCIGGGGQPRSKDKEIAKKRQAALYRRVHSHVRVSVCAWVGVGAWVDVRPGGAGAQPRTHPPAHPPTPPPPNPPGHPPTHPPAPPQRGRAVGDAQEPREPRGQSVLRRVPGGPRQRGGEGALGLGGGGGGPWGHPPAPPMRGRPLPPTTRTPTHAPLCPPVRSPPPTHTGPPRAAHNVRALRSTQV